MLVEWLMIKQYIFATLEFPMTTSITKIAEATFAVHLCLTTLACTSSAVTLPLLVLQAGGCKECHHCGMARSVTIEDHVNCMIEHDTPV